MNFIRSITSNKNTISVTHQRSKYRRKMLDDAKMTHLNAAKVMLAIPYLENET